MAKNCYAVHFIDTHEDVIVYNWPECEKIRKGRPNLFKGFMNDEEANEWLNGITAEKEQSHLEMMERIEKQKAAQAGKTQYTFYIDAELSKDLNSRMNSLHLSIDNLMNDLIREYLYGDE